MKTFLVLLILCITLPAFGMTDEEYFMNRKDIETVYTPKVTHIDAFTKRGCEYLEIEVDNSGTYVIIHNPTCRNHFQSEERRRLNSSKHSHYHN